MNHNNFYQNYYYHVKVGERFKILVNNAGPGLEEGQVVEITHIENEGTDMEKIRFDGDLPPYKPYFCKLSKRVFMKLE